MSHNFEFGLSQATGDWLVVLGDDDGVLPTGISRGMKILAESGADALASRNCYYVWPSARGSDARPFLSVPYGSGWQWRSSKRAIERLLDRDLGFHEIPITYTGGIVRRSLYERIKQVRGTFFHSQIPDCYSAFALCSATERYVFTPEPLMISGVSGHSHGRSSLNLEKSSFKTEDNIPLHPDLSMPDGGTLTFSIQALLVESYLQTSFLRKLSKPTEIGNEIVRILAFAKYFRSSSSGAFKSWEATLDWGRKAAVAHGLDFASVLSRAQRLPIRNRLSQSRQHLNDFRLRYVVDPALNLPVAEVHEAAIVADTIRCTRPSRLDSYARTIRRRLAPPRPSQG